MTDCAIYPLPDGEHVWAHRNTCKQVSSCGCPTCEALVADRKSALRTLARDGQRMERDRD